MAEDSTESKLCYRCKENPAGGPPDNISFVYQELNCSVFRSGGECDVCARKDLERDFDGVEKDFVKKREDDSLEINWQIFLQAEKGRNQNRYDKMARVLVGVSVFSWNMKGNWEILSDGPVGLNPRLSMIYLYFTDERYAKDYARLRFANTLYHWTIRHIDKVLSKEEVLSSV